MGIVAWTDYVARTAVAVVGLMLGARTVMGTLRREKAAASGSRLPPSPQGHWLFGHLLRLPRPEHGVHMEVKWMEWLQECGGQSFLLNLAPFIPRLIVVADPNLARHVLLTKNYPKSPTYSNLAPLIGWQSILTAEGFEWSKKRRVLHPAFTPDALRGIKDVIDEKLPRLIRQCRLAACADSAEQGFRLHDVVSGFTVDVIAQIAFGEDWGSDSGPQHPTYHTMRSLVHECTMDRLKPARKYTSLSRWFRVRRLEAALSRELDAVLQRRLVKIREGRDDPADRDVLSSAIRGFVSAAAIAGTASVSGAEGAEVLSQLKTFFFAGQDTTSTTITWALWLLAQHPAWAARVREEVLRELAAWGALRVAGGGLGGPAPPPGTGSVPGREALGKCVVLEAVLRETLRLYPPAASARYVSDAAEDFDGVCIGGAVVVVSPYVLHRHPQLWEHPNDFRPDRWLPAPPGGSSTRSKPDVDHAAPPRSEWAYLPFSKGPRDCIGQHVAMLEAKMAVAALITQLDLEAVDPAEESPMYRITSVPRNGCRVRARPRRT